MSNFNGYSEAYAVGMAMEKYGGNGFYSHLGRALQTADAENVGRIKESWPIEWAEHLDIARRMPRFQSRK